MRKLQYLQIFIICLLIVGCDSKDHFTLKGELKGLPSDTLLVYFQHPSYRLDTLITHHGTFTYTFTPDTLTVFTLTLPGKKQLPIFAKKGETVTLHGKPNHWTVEGKGENAHLAYLRKQLAPLEIAAQQQPAAKARLMKAVDSCVLAQPYSLTNLYLIDRYYVQDSIPDTKHLKDILKGLSGQLKDTHYFSELMGQIKEWENPNNIERLSYFSCKDKEGKFISSTSFRNKYILLSFWASWHPASLTEQDSLAKAQKALKKEKIQLISVSLDLDRTDWLKICNQRDTTQWNQICDFKGWESSLVKKLGINHIPANLLINPNKQIIGRNLNKQALTDSIKELIEQDQKREKSLQEAKRNLRRAF